MNTLHKFAVLTLSAVLTVCLLAGCGASASSTASSAASSVASSVTASEAASSAASKAQATVEFTVTAADGSVSSPDAQPHACQPQHHVRAGKQRRVLKITLPHPAPPPAPERAFTVQPMRRLCKT